MGCNGYDGTLSCCGWPGIGDSIGDRDGCDGSDGSACGRASITADCGRCGYAAGGIAHPGSLCLCTRGRGGTAAIGLGFWLTGAGGSRGSCSAGGRAADPGVGDGAAERGVGAPLDGVGQRDGWSDAASTSLS